MIEEDINRLPPGGWVAPPAGDFGYPNPSTWTAEYAEIFQARPELGDALVPYSSHMENNGGIATWRFSQRSRDVWLACRYGGLMLARELPDGLSLCAAHVARLSISVVCQ